VTAAQIQAIPTSYAGCLFRSRIEARWAVFFDHLGIAWEYEPQGYLVGPNDDRQPYLPDFYLPNAVPGGIWVEVKGVLSAADQRKIFYASHPVYGLPAKSQRTRVLLLGDVPRVEPGWMCWHHAMGWDFDEQWDVDGTATFTVLFRDDGTLLDIGGPGVGVDTMRPEAANPSAWNFTAFVTDAPCLAWWGASHRISRAYRAARSARFEHGERS
jgi:hypothetical protein